MVMICLTEGPEEVCCWRERRKRRKRVDWADGSIPLGHIHNHQSEICTWASKWRSVPWPGEVSPTWLSRTNSAIKLNVFKINVERRSWESTWNIVIFFRKMQIWRCWVLCMWKILIWVNLCYSLNFCSAIWLNYLAEPFYLAWLSS